jgi:hypothetical protein
VRSTLTAALGLWANPVIDAAKAASDCHLRPTCGGSRRPVRSAARVPRTPSFSLGPPALSRGSPARLSLRADTLEAAGR